MATKQHSQASSGSTKEIVLSFIDALNKEDFGTAKSKVDPAMNFDGVLGSRKGADAYFEDMKKMKLKYAITKVFADGNDACVLAEVSMSGITMFTCLWYTLSEEKIKTIKVVFDPRPALEGAPKK